MRLDFVGGRIYFPQIIYTAEEDFKTLRVRNSYKRATLEDKFLRVNNKEVF